MDSDAVERVRARKLAWIGAAFVAILPLLFHLPYFSGDRILYQADTAQLQYPRYKILCEALQNEGQLPLWQHWLYTGSPFHANPENPTLYPPVLLFARFFTPVWTINLTVLMHLSVAALGMFFLVRRLWLRMDPSAGSSAVATAGAIIGACMFSLSYWTRTDHLNLVAYGATHALIPWVLLCADALLEGPRPRRAAGFLGLLVGFQVLSGGLYVIPYAALSLVLWMVFLGVLGGRERARRALTYGVLAALLAALIVSGKYLPYREWIGVTNRAAELDYAEALGTTLATKRGLFDWDTLWTRLSWFTFFGTTVVLALTAVPLLRRPVVRLAFGLVILCFLIALGGSVHRLMFDYVPVFDQTRNASRAWTGVNALLPVLAGLGCCGLLGRFARLRQRPMALVGVGALIAALLAPCLAYSFRYQQAFTNPERFSELPGLYTQWPAAARSAGKEWRAMNVDRDTPLQRNEQFISTVLEVETPSGYLGHVWPRALEYHLYGKPEAPLSDELRFRRRSTLSVEWMVSTSHAPGAPAVSKVIMPDFVDGNTLTKNLLARARAIEPSVVAAVYGDDDCEVTYAMLDSGTFPLQEASTIQLAAERELTPEELGALDALILRGEPSPQALAAAEAMRALGKTVVTVAVPLSAEDLASVLLVEHDILAMKALNLEPAIDGFERLSSSATIVKRADATRGRWLVLSEPWWLYPGWEARTASGTLANIERADGFSSAIFVPAGEDSVRADYAPKSSRVGLWLYLAGIVIALLVALLPARSQLSSSGASRSSSP